MRVKRASKKIPKAARRKLVDAAYLERLEAASATRPRARGRQPSSDPRRPSHIPLNTVERKKLHEAAAAMGLPYATWARGTLLVVADWPANAQPIRMGGAVRSGGALEELLQSGRASLLSGPGGMGDGGTVGEGNES